MSQSQRQRAITGFRQGKFDLLVATDIAARGIDVIEITHVINFDMPDTVDAYTHRIGRTGRAQETGEAFTFATPDDAPMVRSIEQVLGYQIHRRTIDGFDNKKSETQTLPQQNRSKADTHQQIDRYGKQNQHSGRSKRSRVSNNPKRKLVSGL
jgi:ATP-dependent RNA helicase RhlE